MDPKINKPCPADWNEMTGNDASRHCDKCKKSVHNISQLSKEEAEQVLCHSTQSVCIRIQQAANGAFKTQSGWMKRVAIAGAATLTLIPMTGCETQSQITGEAATYSQPNSPVTTGKVAASEPQPEQGEPLTGVVAGPMETGEIAVPKSNSQSPTTLVTGAVPAPPSDTDTARIGRMDMSNKK
jgi:hypothetical protein